MASVRDRANECIPTSLGGWWLPIGRLSFAHLFEPSLPPGETDPKKLKYNTSVIFRGNVIMTPLQKAIDAAVLKKFGKADTRYKNPILDHREKSKDVELGRQFPILVRTQSQYKPGIVFPSGDQCNEKEQAYSGRWARVYTSLFVWNHPVGGKGVSLNLNHVVLLDDDTRFGGSGATVEQAFSDVFTPDEGDFASRSFAGDVGGTPEDEDFFK